MSTTLPERYDNRTEQPACDCPTHRTPGTRYDAITTVHVPSCQLYRPGDSTTRTYVAGTLDQRLDAAFGPDEIDWRAVQSERFGPAAPCEGGMWCRCPQSSPCPTRAAVTR